MQPRSCPGGLEWEGENSHLESSAGLSRGPTCVGWWLLDHSVPESRLSRGLGLRWARWTSQGGFHCSPLNWGTFITLSVSNIERDGIIDGARRKMEIKLPSK